MMCFKVFTVALLVILASLGVSVGWAYLFAKSIIEFGPVGALMSAGPVVILVAAFIAWDTCRYR